jgi:membrane protease YdiL (CAAX protease family)
MICSVVARRAEPVHLPALFGLGAVGLASLALTTTVNRTVGSFTHEHNPVLDWLANTCLASCLALFSLYILVRRTGPFRIPKPETDWRSIRSLSLRWLMVWLLGSVGAAVVKGGWYASAHGWSEIFAFLLFAPIGEEILFRGLVFELAEQALPSRPNAPILLSTLFFSLHHFELHHFQATPAALLQVGFTLPMGFAFGYLRRQSGSLWPSLGLHMLTNLPGVFGY